MTKELSIQENLAKKIMLRASYVSHSGKVYRLIETETSLEDIYKGVTQEAVALVQQYASSYEKKEKELKEQFLAEVIMPTVSLKDIEKYKLILYRIGSGIGYILPFHYRPRFVYIKGVTLPLNDETRASLERRVLLDLIIVRGSPPGLELYSTLGSMCRGEPFSHYHQSCWGKNPLTCPSNFQEVIALRDYCENLLETINTDSLAIKSPLGMFHSDSLKDRLVKTGETSKLLLSSPSLGTLLVVKCVYDSFPPEYVGSIGRVIRDSGNPINVLLEFAFRHDNLHNGNGLGKPHQCYYFPLSCLAPTKGKTRNTGLPVKIKPTTRLESAGEGIFNT